MALTLAALHGEAVAEKQVAPGSTFQLAADLVDTAVADIAADAVEIDLLRALVQGVLERRIGADFLIHQSVGQHLCLVPESGTNEPQERLLTWASGRILRALSLAMLLVLSGSKVVVVNAGDFSGGGLRRAVLPKLEYKPVALLYVAVNNAALPRGGAVARLFGAVGGVLVGARGGSRVLPAEKPPRSRFSLRSFLSLRLRACRSRRGRWRRRGRGRRWRASPG